MIIYKQILKIKILINIIRLLINKKIHILIKILRIDWRKGEKYFAQNLIDYDIASNNENWQWSSSTGADSQPYFRIFNPWRQALKFDKQCIYIKMELVDI